LQMDLSSYFEKQKDVLIKDLSTLLSFPSISVEPEHHADCDHCAEWLVSHLAGVGFNSRILETPARPAVYAEYRGPDDAPTVLFYGHYDVQPVDPLDEWDSPPFEPVMRGDRVYARGAQDNKGQLFYALSAMAALIEHNELNLTVKVLIEGEEESGSSGASTCLEKWKGLLEADVLMVCDTSCVRSGAPAITMGLKGIIGLSVELSGPTHDLHSGVHGGVAPNPAQAMARLLASLHNPDGNIAVEGFLDDVREPSTLERDLANAVPFDSELYEEQTGVPPEAGDSRLPPYERIGFLPTIDINGVSSGYSGAGIKTIVPKTAVAKITSRLVPDQDPDKCLDVLIAHLESHAPDSLSLSVTDATSGGPGFRLNPQSDLAAKAKVILDDLTEHEAAHLWEGASIPIVSALASVSGAEPLLVGFGLEEDKCHAPNESFSLKQFKLGYIYVAQMLLALSTGQNEQ
jgi:acetylornithine deacetylase/succinyl-diaminopimelate desuccinylase-like protein